MQIAADKESVTPKGDQERNVGDSAQDIFVMPATPSQLRYWWLHQMRPGNHALNMPLAWTCAGGLDHARAAAALGELVRRHESLRTTFEAQAGSLSQIIHPPADVPLAVDDLRSLPKEGRLTRASEITQREARVRMDIEKGPLMMARAIRMDDATDILLITIHHIVCDGWSNGIVLRDFAAIYDGLTQNITPDLPELPIQFGDFAVWLEDWQKGPEPALSLEYWRGTLKGNFEPLHIPRDFEGNTPEELGEIETLLLAPDLVQRARDFCVSHNITLYMFMLSVYVITLHRLSGQRDIVIGTPCANRRVGTEDLIGPFSNPQVVRLILEQGETFASVLGQVRDWTLGAVGHQDLPFEDLNADEFFSREENQIPLSVYFIFQKAFMQVQRTSSLEIVPLRSISPGTMFDLTLSIVERTEGPRLQLEYNPGFFRVSTIQRVLRLFLRILEVSIANSEIAADSSEFMVGMMPSAVAQFERMAASAQDRLSRNGTGSEKANLDAEDGASTEKTSQERVAPRDPLEVQVAGIWETSLAMKDLSIRDNFFDLGGRSLAAMRIISHVNRIYSVDFGLATLFTGNTIERMADLIRKRLSANTTSAIVPLQPQGSAAPLFIIHGAGGNIIRFYQLAKLVGTDHPIYGIQAQSLLPGKPALLRLEDQAEYYLSEVRKIQPNGPYFFLGYSFGGTTAFEMAHQLRAQGERVELLGMLDSRQRDYMVVMQSQDSVKTRFGRRMARFWGNFLPLSTADKVGYLREKLFTRTLRHLYGVALTLGFKTVPAYMKSTEDISWIAAINYHPKPWPGPITLFRASTQPDPRFPWDLGWSPLAEGGVETYELPGDHDLVFREQNIRVLAEQLRTRLELSDASLAHGVTARHV